jgi:uncharacterized protein (DUF1697 family)
VGANARYVAFLRAINVGGHVVTMDVLRREFEALGLSQVETFIASGNVMFSTRVTDTQKLARRIETRLKECLGYEVHTFIRTVDEVASVASYAPFPPAQIKTALALNVGFLAAPLAKDAHAMLMSLQTPLDTFHVNGREIYWLSKAKQSESKISNAVLERALKTRSTFRGMNTIVRLTSKLNLSRRSRKGVGG